MSSNVPPRYVVIGQLNRMYLLPPKGRPLLDQPGGNLLYAAAGLGIWDKGVGLVARVGEDYPRAWLRDFEKRDFDIRGIHILPQAMDLRAFLAYSDLSTRFSDNPVAHFAQRAMPFPKALFGYQDTVARMDKPSTLRLNSLRQADLHPDFLLSTAVHFCPLEYSVHSLLPAVLRQSGFTTITLDPGRGYMDAAFWEQVPSILTGLTAFLVSEDKVRALFRGRSDDLWEMAETLASYGCGIIVIKRGLQGQYLYDAENKVRWEISAYPSRDADPTGAGDAFSGGFLAGYRKTFDPLQATLHGNVAASLAVEGSGPFYALDAIPGLAEARLEVVQQSVRKL